MCRPLKILVADDSPAVLAPLGRILRDLGHLVTSTNNGADAMCLLAAGPHDLLFLDLNMGDVDGYTVLQKLGPTAPPVVVITGEEVSVAGLGGGKVARVIKKPFGRGEVLHALESIFPAVPEPAAVVG